MRSVPLLALMSQVSEVRERNLKCYRLQHTATLAEHLHIEADDTENAFWCDDDLVCLALFRLSCI